MAKPLLLTDGRYVFVHMPDGARLGPLNCPRLTEDGQIENEESNSSDPYGVPFNPRECAGGRIHRVENPLFAPAELADLMDEG